jgi:hypothetical protein
MPGFSRYVQARRALSLNPQASSAGALCLAILVLWARSYWRIDAINRQVSRPGADFTQVHFLDSGEGRFIVAWRLYTCPESTTETLYFTPLFGESFSTTREVPIHRGPAKTEWNLNSFAPDEHSFSATEEVRLRGSQFDALGFGYSAAKHR